MTTNITTAADNNLTGFENYDDSDRVMPRIGIVQPTSEEGTKGNFRSNLTGDETKEMSIVPLTFSKARILWGDNLGDDPKCKSRDAIKPDESIENPVCDQCATMQNGRLTEVCPSAMWQGEGTNRTKPECQMQYNLAALDEDGAPFMMSFRGSALKPFKALISGLISKRKPLCDNVVHMTIKEMKGEKGVYYVPQFKVTGSVDEPGMYLNTVKEVTAYKVADESEPF